MNTPMCVHTSHSLPIAMHVYDYMLSTIVHVLCISLLLCVRVNYNTVVNTQEEIF